jgi:hypothetical protein
MFAARFSHSSRVCHVVAYSANFSRACSSVSLGSFIGSVWLEAENVAAATVNTRKNWLESARLVLDFMVM